MSLTAIKTPATILIIDDAPENRHLLKSQLKREHYNLLSASTGQAGVDIALHQQPDLILLDVMLPGINGFEVCRILKADPKTSNIPIIILTTLRDVSFRIQGIEAGADEFLSRPHHREELIVRVRSLVRLKHAREELEAEHRHLRLLNDVSKATMRHIDLEKIITEIIHHTQKAVGATKGSVILTDGDGRVTHKYLARQISGISISESIADRVMRDGFAGWLWYNKRGDIVKDTRNDSRWVPLPDDVEPAGSAVGVPLVQAEYGTLGLIILTHPLANYFTQSHLSLLQTIGGQVTVTLRNARLFERVRDERRKLEAVLEQSNDAIVTTDEDLRIMLFNQTAERTFGLCEEDVVGKFVSDITRLSSLYDLFDQAMRGPVGRDIVLDEKRILYASVSPIQGTGYIAVLQDVTERIKMERREREELREIFGRYVSPSLLDHAIQGDTDIFAHQKRWAIVMFADLRNNTEMVVNLPADEALSLLNEIFDDLMEIIFAHQGTVLDLIGDELEVSFNVPFDQPDAAQRALQTAIEMQERFNERQAEWSARSGVNIGLGIGIDQGEVVIGNVGSHRRMNLALVGEAVNTAHRLVDLAEDGQIVVSEGFYEKIKSAESPNHLLEINFTPIRDIYIKGKPETTVVYCANQRRRGLLPA